MNHMNRIAVTALLVATAMPQANNAASRNCNAAEKSAANSALLSIQGDSVRSQELVELHLPFGAHVPQGAPIGERLLVHGGYVSGYDDDLLTTLWVSYRLTKADLTAATGKDRVNCFRKDPRLGNSPAPSDYKEAIFDQGHMTNDADLKDDLNEQINTYVMSNMSPQHCRFNRGIWLSLEHLTRKLANEHSTIFVTSGAILDRNGDGSRDADANAVRMQSNNGFSRVAVPSHYYKIIVREGQDGPKSISFLLDHNNDFHGRKWSDVKPAVLASVTTIGAIESRAGLTLHPALDRSTLTESANGSGWNLEGVKASAEPPADSTNVCVTTTMANPQEDATCRSVDSCCRVCSASQACGDACISRTLECSKEPGCACDAASICP